MTEDNTDFMKIVSGVFDDMGATPDDITIPGVAIGPGDSISLYAIGGVPRPFLSQEEAEHNNLGGGAIYKVDIYKVEARRNG
jgi:hypothetical protein